MQTDSRTQIAPAWQPNANTAWKSAHGGSDVAEEDPEQHRHDETFSSMTLW